jgi:hypothetical protein
LGPGVGWGPAGTLNAGGAAARSGVSGNCRYPSRARAQVSEAGSSGDTAGDGGKDGSGGGGGRDGGGSGATSSSDAADAAAALPPQPGAPYAVAAVNAAHVMVLQGRHASALALLEPLFDRAEAVSGGAALHLCLLLLEAYLGSRQHTKAAEVVAYLELALGLGPDGGALRSSSGGGGGGGDSGGGGGDGGGDGAAQGEGGDPAAGDGGVPPPPAVAAPPPLSPDARTALQLPRVSRATSPFMERVRAALAARDAAAAAAGPEPHLLLRLLRARLALAAGYPRAARRDIKALLAVLPRCEGGLMLKAQLEAARGHPRKALRTLGPLLAPAGGGEGDGGGAPPLARPAARLALLNNLGVLHHQFGKHQLAAVYLARALSEAGARRHGAPAPPPAGGGSSSSGGDKGSSSGGKGGGSGGGFTGLWADHSHAAQYNLGLQHLMLRNWGAALTCFDAAGQRFYMQPLLWLRMAEANVGLHCEGQREARQREEQQSEAQQQEEGSAGHPLLAGVAGVGPRRRLLLPAGHVLPAGAGPAGEADGGGERLWHEGPLGAALLQLQTALALLQECKAEAAKEAEEAAAAAAALAAAGGAPNGRRSGGDASPPARRSSGAEAGGGGGGGGGTDAALQPRGSGGDASPSGGGAASGSGATGARRLSDCLPPEELEAIGQAVWSNLAYVHLLRDDAVPALAAAQQLLACSGLSAQQHYLGSCYAAEAHCMLGRPADAAEQLRAHLALFHDAAAGASALQQQGTAVSAAEAPSTSIKSDDDGAGGPREVYPLGNAPDAAALSGQAARAGALVNLAAAAALQGEMPEARRLGERALTAAAAAAACPGGGGGGPGGGPGGGAAAAARLLLVYCELRKGDAAAALALLRDAGAPAGGKAAA